MTETSQAGPDGIVAVLGAGFSRALSDAMPLTDELGNLCLDNNVSLRTDPRVPDGGFTGGLFETWLSRLADDQPYLTADENLENQALFLRFSAVIADKLGSKVHDALAAGWPQWFPEFLRLCHYTRSTLLTFNYDTLIECGVSAGVLHDIDQRQHVYWAEVLGDVPSWAPGTMRLAATRTATFRLLKLHGSLNWYWSPGDTTGVSVARRDLPGAYGAPNAYDEEDRRRELPGRVPLVVPPSATKSPYYRNPFMREIWMQAASALRQASNISIIGYSLPSTDLTFASMFADSLKRSSPVITVVDLNPASVSQRLISLGIRVDQIHEVSEETRSPVEKFVKSWRNTVGLRLIGRLTADYRSLLDDPLLVYWNNKVAAVVTGLQDHHEGLLLVTGHWRELGLATQGCSESDPPLLTLRELLHQIGDDTARLIIEASTGQYQTIIASTTWRTGTGAGRGIWTVLIPSGVAPTPDS